MLARMLGLYRERVEVTTQEAPERLSDFEAAKTIAFILAKAGMKVVTQDGEAVTAETARVN